VDSRGADGAGAVSGVTTLLVDSQSPQNVYAFWSDDVLRKSADGGATWSNLPYTGSYLASLAIDPAVSGNLWGYTQFVFGGSFSAGTPPYLWHSSDGGATWNKLTSPAPVLNGPILFDPSTKPSTIYIGADFRSDDGGATWIALPRGLGPVSNQGPLAVGPGGTLYAAVYNDGIYTSHDKGATWVRMGAGPSLVTTIVPTADPDTLFVLIQNSQTAGFVTKLRPDGASIAFSTFLGGHFSFGGGPIFAAEPGGLTWQNGISALALDRQGNVVVAGATIAKDFPLTGGATCTNAGGSDAFVATISGDGSRLISVECFGGTQADGALGVAAGPRGGVVVVGQTWSPESPGFVGFGDAFVAEKGEVSDCPERVPPIRRKESLRSDTLQP